VHPPQEEAEAEELTVWPEADLETKPQHDISLPTSSLAQDGHWGISFPNTRHSNSCPHLLHLYSKIGIQKLLG
jgi:hypothetical protein